MGGWVILTAAVGFFNWKVAGLEAVHTAMPAAEAVSAGRNTQPLRSDRGARHRAKSFLGGHRDNARVESSFKTLCPELEAPDGKHSAGGGWQSALMRLPAYYNRNSYAFGA
jgi:hypothetical protein